MILTVIIGDFKYHFDGKSRSNSAQIKRSITVASMARPISRRLAQPACDRDSPVGTQKLVPMPIFRWTLSPGQGVATDARSDASTPARANSVFTGCNVPEPTSCQWLHLGA
jgi:hypothetical protein